MRNLIIKIVTPIPDKVLKPNLPGFLPQKITVLLDANMANSQVENFCRDIESPSPSYQDFYEWLKTVGLASCVEFNAR